MANIVLLDGPPGAGKSRMKNELLNRIPELVFCPRLATRQPRGDESDQDYFFVSPEEFARREQAGQLAAWRHFQFGMSYGLPKDSVQAAIERGRSVLALIDLGTVKQAKACWPEASGVLLYAPIEDLRGRLLARGKHTGPQLEERLDNAVRVMELVDDYDLTLCNQNGHWDQTVEQMLSLFKSP